MKTRQVAATLGIVSVAAGALPFSPAELVAQNQFEGVVTYAVYTQRQPQTSVVTAKGTRLRAEGWDEGGNGAEGGVLLVNAKGDVIMAMPEQKMYVRPGARMPLDKPTHAVTFTKTGRSDSILGQSCEYYTMHNPAAPEEDRDLCITTSLGTIAMIPGKLFAGAEGRAQFPNGFLVLKSVDNKGKVLAVATKIDRHPIDDGVFEIAPDWKEIGVGARGRPQG